MTSMLMTAVVLAFPADPARWSGYGPNPRFMKNAPVSRAGAYTLNNLPAGEYCLIAIDGADVEGWTDAHDDEHSHGEMARAAAAYAVSDRMREPGSDGDRYTTSLWPWSLLWPWDMKWWKPKDRRRDLIRAAALIVAEIERIDRSAERNGTPEPVVRMGTGGI